MLRGKAEQWDHLVGATILQNKKNEEYKRMKGNERTECIKMAEHFREGGVVRLILFTGGKLFSAGGGFPVG
jgi:hypothetical protein